MKTKLLKLFSLLALLLVSTAVLADAGDEDAQAEVDQISRVMRAGVDAISISATSPK